MYAHHLRKLKNNHILQGGIIILIIACVFWYFESQKKYIHLSMSEQYAPQATKEFSGFEEHDGWQGNYSFDTGRAMEGKTSMTFTSWYGKESTITLMREIELKGYKRGTIMVFVKDTAQLRAVDKLYLELYEGSEKKYTTALTTGLKAGWNTVTFTLPDLERINVVKLHIMSKPAVIAEINLDRLWFAKESIDTIPSFDGAHAQMSIRTLGNRTYLFVSPSSKQRYSLLNPPRMRGGSVTVGVIAERSGTIGLGVNGTTMQLMGGSHTTCMGRQLKKVSGADDYYIFLRATIDHNAITYSVSNNDVDYEICGTVKRQTNDGPSLVVQGSYLIDSIDAEYN